MTRFGIDPAGYPFIGGGLVISLVAWLAGGWIYALAPLVLAGFFVFFFRDPDREITQRPDAVLAPADGRVMVAGPADPEAAPKGEWLQISIFLSPMDVHVNRVPASGRVTSVSYRPGKYLAAYRQGAASVNERSEIWIERNGQTVVARQIVGLLARRVVCRLKPGTEVQAGDRYGVMKFGSRMDVFLPTTAQILVRPGDMVRGGQTVIAVLHSGVRS
jgi:phosphatidylserine decarboxylase